MDDRHAIQHMVLNLIDAWNRGNAQRFAAAFAPSAEYVAGLGQHVRGRDRIAELVVPAHSDPRVTMVGRPRIELDGSAGTVRFGWTAAGEGREPRQGFIRCTVVRHVNRWLIERLENDETT